jgi:hypothetical protein
MLEAVPVDQMKSLMRHALPGRFLAAKNNVTIRNSVTNTDLISEQRGKTLTPNLMVQITPHA